MEISDFQWDEDSERKFWEEHSIADYWKDLRESDDRFERPKLTPVTVKFDPLVLKKIKMLAKKRGIPYNAYIRYLLSRGVETEISFKPSQGK
jgi:predicted DNA binding CopG/RHH family protein